MASNIDESLNLLKSLQNKLKYHQNILRDSVNRRNPQSTKNSPYLLKMDTIERQLQHCPKIESETDGDLLLENKRLKRYMFRLVKMNDYLKNQLAKQQYYEKTHNPYNAYAESEALRMEVQYLKEVNREKQLQVHLCQKKMLNQRDHSTSVVVLPNKFQSEKQSRPSSCLKEHTRFHSTIKTPKSSKRDKSRTTSSIKKTASSNKKTIASKESRVKTPKKSKCRLCY